MNVEDKLFISFKNELQDVLDKFGAEIKIVENNKNDENYNELEVSIDNFTRKLGHVLTASF